MPIPAGTTTMSPRRNSSTCARACARTPLLQRSASRAGGVCAIVGTRREPAPQPPASTAQASAGMTMRSRRTASASQSSGDSALEAPPAAVDLEPDAEALPRPLAAPARGQHGEEPHPESPGPFVIVVWIEPGTAVADLDVN